MYTYLHHQRIANSEATPKGGFKDDEENIQTDPDPDPVEFQWILHPSGTDALSSRVLSAWLT